MKKIFYLFTLICALSSCNSDGLYHNVLIENGDTVAVINVLTKNYVPFGHLQIRDKYAVDEESIKKICHIMLAVDECNLKKEYAYQGDKTPLYVDIVKYFNNNKDVNLGNGQYFYNEEYDICDKKVKCHFSENESTSTSSSNEKIENDFDDLSKRKELGVWELTNSIYISIFEQDGKYYMDNIEYGVYARDPVELVKSKKNGNDFYKHADWDPVWGETYEVVSGALKVTEADGSSGGIYNRIH